MMVPRSFKYSSSPPKEVLDEKSARRHARKVVAVRAPEQKTVARPAAPEHSTTMPVKIVSKPVDVPTPERSYSTGSRTMPARMNRSQQTRRKPVGGAHDPDALPPALAALLAVTAIPPRRSIRVRRRTGSQRRMSIDELVNEWRSDDTFKASYGTSPALNVLLEDSDDAEDSVVVSSVEEGTLHARSASAESVPSLEADERSLLSFGSPSTPESLRSKKSSGNLKRDRARSQATTEDSSSDHPLVPPSLEDEDDFVFSATSSRSSTPKPKPSFTSNLTTSLKALKSAAINSISSFGLGTSTTPGSRATPPLYSDEMLWSHPYLFPHLSSEIRPDIQGTPTQAQRRYLNPTPLTFEEQEAPFQQALHAPFLAEQTRQVPSTAHEMQTYSRNRRKGGNNHNSNQKRASSDPDPQSEVGRAMLAAAGVRQREPRENSDFLRVVVLEMNMRREGKLESGRARIWLPPRQVSPATEEMSRVPKRWAGESAY